MLNLYFSINYYTHPESDENLFINFTEVDKDGNKLTSKYPLTSADHREWCVSLVLHENIVAFDYFYSVDKNDEEVRSEWNKGKRRYDCTSWGEEKTVLFKDAWYDISSLSYLWSTAFTNCWQVRDLVKTDLLPFINVVELRVSIPGINKGEEVLLSGNIPEFGQWNPELALPLNEFVRNEWNIRFTLSLFLMYKDIEYKLIIRDKQVKKTLKWEEGSNRHLSIPDTGCNCVVKDLAEPQFSIPDRKKVAGVVVPLFALRSERSYGVGDFGDLKRLVDWAVSTGMHIIQILPINDTTLTHTWMDSYPYNCISIYALHPQYMDLSQLNPIHDRHKQKQFEQRRTLLEGLPQIDYEAANTLKSEYLHELYLQEGKRVLRSQAFADFFNQNKGWLIPYAAFCFLRETFGTADFTRWPEFSRYNAADIRRLCMPEGKNYEEIAYYYYIQYQLDKQLTEVGEYARQHGVVLKGDIPIGISRESVDTWTEPYYFNMDSQTGAPPDPFSEKGQNWGFPTYNWSSMQADKCKWWVGRFRKMNHYFDAYRIDHILGFFRIWEIPSSSVYGLLGQFSPSLPLSITEIENYGLHFKKELFTHPYITKEILNRLFGCKTETIIDYFLQAVGEQRYSLKEEYNTQRKVQNFFRQQADGLLHPFSKEELKDIEEKLYTLISNVLFIEDRRKTGLYHPRIGVQTDFVYKLLLDNNEKEAFNCIYNDYFYHRHNEFWYQSAGKKLPRLVESTQMLVCGEDLGMIPGCVPWLMKDLRILSLEIESMPKTNDEFADVLRNPYLSVCTIATHDMPTFREWWEENHQRTRRYYNHILKHKGDAPIVASGEICREVIERHLGSPSMLCLLSLQDWLAMDEQLRNPDCHAERINIPAESRHYWRYRMHITIEQLLESTTFNNQIKSMILNSGRA